MDKKSGEYFVQVCLNGFEDVPVVRIFQTEVFSKLLINLLLFFLLYDTYVLLIILAPNGNIYIGK